MAFLKSPTFWGGLIVGYLLSHFVPSLSLGSKASGKIGL